MGQKFVRFLSRMREFPIKRQPICFHLQENFKSTGEELQMEARRHEDNPFDEMLESFAARLNALRQQNLNRKASEAEQYPGWDGLTLENLHAIFMLFTGKSQCRMDFTKFSSCLDCLGDNTSRDFREKKFKGQDKGAVGWISYDQFLNLVYNYDPPDRHGIHGLAKLCFETAENIRFVSSLSVGEQLKSGLF